MVRSTIPQLSEKQGEAGMNTETEKPAEDQSNTCNGHKTPEELVDLTDEKVGEEKGNAEDGNGQNQILDTPAAG